MKFPPCRLEWSGFAVNVEPNITTVDKQGIQLNSGNPTHRIYGRSLYLSKLQAIWETRKYKKVRSFASGFPLLRYDRAWPLSAAGG
jgi:hypothetical protein